MKMSKPRPIHQPPRDLRSTPDEAEPSYSFEQESFMGREEDDVEDEFHRRLQSGNRREGGGGGGPSGGGSFWRTFDAASGTNGNLGNGQQSPSFSSVNMSFQKPEQATSKSTGLLVAALQAHSDPAASPNNMLQTTWNGDNNRFQNRRDSATANRRGSSNGSQRATSVSSNMSNTLDAKKKDVSKQRTEARRLKHEAQTSDVDIGHFVMDDEKHNELDNGGPAGVSGGVVIDKECLRSISAVSQAESISMSSRARSDESAGSVLYGKAPNSGVLFGKSSSLIFPTGVDPTKAKASGGETANLKRRKINLLLDQCETVRFPFKKKLILSNLLLTAEDIPVKDLCGTPLGNSLHKLSLAGNRLGTVPPKLVQCLPVLKHMDLSQCELHQLPEQWNLPLLRRLNLSHNRLTEFLEEGMLEGLPDLQDLNMYGNKVAEIIVPHNGKYLCKLEVLNLGYNDLAYLPDDLDQLRSLRTLRVMNNFLEKVPMRVCDMDLRMIDVSSNPVIQPPIETCERGIYSMKRYYHCLRMEEQAKPKSDDSSKKSLGKKKKSKGFGSVINNGIMNSMKPKFILPAKSLSSSTHRKSVDESSSEDVKPSRPNINPPASSRPASEPDLSTPFEIEDAEQQVVDDLDVGKVRAAPIQSKDFQRDTSSASVSVISHETADVTADRTDASVVESPPPTADPITVNDTLKVIFVGMAMVGKTSMIKRLIEGNDAVIPTHDERTVGVDIYNWDPKEDKRFEHIDSRIEFQDKELSAACGDVNVKFSVWDFAGQHVYHATHELFFSNRALYVLVWDMGATNRATMKRKNSTSDERGAFKLSYDSSDEESESDEEDFFTEEEIRRADRALERDIDEKVQFWVDCIQSSAPGAAILPVASFDDYFLNDVGGQEEAKRRCNILKERLLKHEERRLQGIKDRLQQYHEQNRANDEGAVRLRKLLCTYTRPKLIFGTGEQDSVVRVSGTMYTGFDKLTEKIINIAACRDNCGWRYPIFRGHVGVRIPRMRLEVREAVRTMRDRFKVVEWGYFLNQLRERGLTSVEDISDALHFLTNVGELSYFGAILAGRSKKGRNPNTDMENTKEGEIDDLTVNTINTANNHDDDDDDFDYEDNAMLSIDNTSLTAAATEDASLSSVGDWMTIGLSQFVFLNPRWLVAAVACILRHDLEREIQETRRALMSGTSLQTESGGFYDAHLNCPIITASDACMLWQAKKITKKAAERAQEYSNNMTVTPFEFLLLLLIRFGVFVPIDLSIDKALLGGREYTTTNSRLMPIDPPTPSEIHIDPDMASSTQKARFFFLPSLLGPGEPAEAWTYKNSDSWKTTLCHSILFPDSVPPGLMERLTASVLSNIYAVAHRNDNVKNASEGRIKVKEVLCWRTAFFIKIGTQVSHNGESKESIVEIFTHLADRESHLCVGSDYMGVGMRRLIISGKGQVGDGGRKIWQGGYLLAIKSISRVMEEYGGLEYEKQGCCTDCLEKMPLSKTSAWDLTVVRAAALNGEGTLRCRHGHRVETRLIAGPVNAPPQKQKQELSEPKSKEADPIVPVNDLLRGVVVVGLWDGKTRTVVRVGSGFVADRKRGLIVTAAHTLMNIGGDANSRFGENYYGLPQGKVVIGIIPRKKDAQRDIDTTMAVFRYFAKIVTKDPDIDNGECHLDACVLRITTRMEQDVGGDGQGCGDQPERLLLNNPDALKREKLQQLKITEKCELDEQVRILGYNQGGEGLLGPGEHLNRYIDFARGYVCKQFSNEETSSGNSSCMRHRFKPRREVVVICPTIGGHSGGPCVNQQGEVIGILSRADPAESQRCYLVPTRELIPLLKKAKNTL